jgi:tetratricopeptide (TPR) repeat protein
MRAAPGAWVVALRQAIRNGSGKVLCDALDACDHGRWQAARGPLLGALVEVLANLVEHDEAALECFLETLAEVPSRTDVTLLLDTFERARAKGRRRAMGLVVEALQRETATWDDVHLHTEVLVRELEMCLDGSDGARTASVMASLQVALDNGAATELAARAEVCLGRVQLAAGRFSLAGEHFERARRLAQELGRLGAASDACRWRSAAESNLGDSQQALELAKEALRIARDCGDKAREGAAYHRVATVEHSLGEHALSRDHYERALVLHRMTGHPDHAAASALNLGVLLIDSQEVDRAREVIESALTRFEEVGHARGLSATLVNLALLARLRGDTHNAVSLALRAREINASRMSPVELARDLWLLAELALDGGDLAAAKAYRDELLTFDFADPARRSIWALHLAALDLRAEPSREGSVADVIQAWNATVKCGVYLNPEERPVALLRELAARPEELRGVRRALECLERGTTLLEWEMPDE